MSTIKDPALYRRMSEPHASQKDAADAMAAFFVDLRAIREKHRIRDILCVGQVAHVEGDGETLKSMVMTVGSGMESLHLAATAYGMLRSQTEAELDEATAVKSRKRGAS